MLSQVERENSFYFDIDNDAFEGDIDRFIQFFICPKFNEESIEREINPVDSEFRNNKNTDIRRLNQLFKSEIVKGCPFSKFSTGNKETLNYPDIRDCLLKMYNTYYSSVFINLLKHRKLPLHNLGNDTKTYLPKRENFEMPKFNAIKIKKSK